MIEYDKYSELIKEHNKITDEIRRLFLMQYGDIDISIIKTRPSVIESLKHKGFKDIASIVSADEIQLYRTKGVEELC